MGDALVRMNGVRKSYRTGRTRLRALDGVDLELRAGETLGLVGESGSGKSTLARILMMLERPDAGSVEFGGVDVATMRGPALRALRRRIQIVFQDPYSSLNPHLSVYELVAEPWRSNRGVLPRERWRERAAELVEMVGMESDCLGRYPHEFSGGQRQRIGIARALALGPEVLVCDEPVSALDLSVQAQVLNVLSDLQGRLGVASLFITHDLSVVRHVASTIAVLYLGAVVEHGPAAEVLDRPRHPYTAALLSAAPQHTVGARRRTRIVLSGDLPSPLDVPSGCRFRTRCWKAQDRCAVEAPPLRGAGHAAACHFPLTEVDTVGREEVGA